MELNQSQSGYKWTKKEISSTEFRRMSDDKEGHPSFKKL